MNEAAKFDPKAFLATRNQGPLVPAPASPAPTSPQILGVDSDDDFSNLTSSFATLGDVGHPTSAIDGDASPEPAQSRNLLLKKQSSPSARDGRSVNIQGSADLDSTNVALPPGHTGHHTPSEVIENQLFTGYGVPQRLPVGFGRRMPSAPRRAPLPLRSRQMPPAILIPAPTQDHFQPKTALPEPVSAEVSAKVDGRQQDSPAPLPRTSTMVDLPSRQPTRPPMGSFPVRGPPRAVRPPARPTVPVRRQALPPGRPTRPLIQTRSSMDPSLQEPKRPSVLQPPNAAQMGSSEPRPQISADQFPRRGNPPTSSIPPPFAFRSEVSRRPAPAPFRPRSVVIPSRQPGFPSRNPPQQQKPVNPPQQQKPLDKVEPEDEQVQSAADRVQQTSDNDGWDGYQSPSPLLLPAQRHSQGPPPVSYQPPPLVPARKSAALTWSDKIQQNGQTLSPDPFTKTGARSPVHPPSFQPELPSAVDSSTQQTNVEPYEHALSAQFPSRENKRSNGSVPVSATAHETNVPLSISPNSHPASGSSSAVSRGPSPAASLELQTSLNSQLTLSRFGLPDARPGERASSREKSTDSHPAWFDSTSRRLSPSTSVVESIPAERREFFIQKARMLSQRHQEEIASLKQQIQKLKASLRASPGQELTAVPDSSVALDDCLPHSFAENSRLVRRAMEEQLDNNARIEAMLSKVTFIVESHSYPEMFHDHIKKTMELREVKVTQEMLATSEVRIRELIKENELLSKQLLIKDERIKSVQEESRVLVETLRQSLEQETFERKRMNALYDEERHVLNASLRETIQSLAADNERYRVRLLEAGLSDD